MTFASLSFSDPHSSFGQRRGLEGVVRRRPVPFSLKLDQDGLVGRCGALRAPDRLLLPRGVPEGHQRPSLSTEGHEAPEGQPDRVRVHLALAGTRLGVPQDAEGEHENDSMRQRPSHEGRENTPGTM